MEKLQDNFDIDIHWHAFMLRPPGSPPMPPAYRERIEASRPALLQRTSEQYGLEMNPGPLGIDSRPALIAEKYAASQGKGNAFHDAIMKAYWQKARSIDDPAVLQEIATEVGLQVPDISAVLSNSSYEDAVSTDMKQAHSYGLDAVPALIFNAQYLVSGAQPYELLKRVVEKVQEEDDADKTEST
ncbi:hypothetical protein EPA93_30955 [Ktedonosporobacter rubrisoli]|uniref:DSBA-like thioredoxin domain-containing protein n=1 Tax=Ktedonosporobacter rubrisoli TaxID=2509675 RepID=A0A4V0YZL7_KTERU|nr:hypothetical protein EPA93_30955 [Ktedonosporobacter rubrisoli]